MTPLHDIIRDIETRNQTIKGLFDLKLLNNLSQVLEQYKKLQIVFTGLNGITEIASTISHQMRTIDFASRTLSSSISSQLSTIQPLKLNSAFFGLSSTLFEIAKSNQFLSDRLASLAANQLLLSNNLITIANSITQSHLCIFNSLDISLQGVSKSYLKNIVLTRNWDDISIVDEATETVANISDELLSSTRTITVDDIDYLKKTIITELSGLLSKTQSEKAKQFILEFITIISFLLCFFNPFQIPTDKTNSEVIKELKIDIEKINKGLSIQIEKELQKFNKSRVAKTNVNLFFSANKNSKIIGLIKPGQKITVIEIRHKFLLITYIDKDTREPKSGFVMKKYFKVNK